MGPSIVRDYVLDGTRDLRVVGFSLRETNDLGAILWVVAVAPSQKLEES